MSATASTDRSLPDVGPAATRCAAAGAVVVAALHLWAGVAHGHGLAFTALTTVMALSCLVCSVRCLRSPCRNEATLLLGMSAAMAAVHVAWLLAGAGHDHAGGTTLASHTSSGLTMAGLALAEVGVTALCGLALRRGVDPQ